MSNICWLADCDRPIRCTKRGVPLAIGFVPRAPALQNAGASFRILADALSEDTRAKHVQPMMAEADRSLDLVEQGQRSGSSSRGEAEPIGRPDAPATVGSK